MHKYMFLDFGPMIKVSSKPNYQNEISKTTSVAVIHSRHPPQTDVIALQNCFKQYESGKLQLLLPAAPTGKKRNYFPNK